MRKGKREAAIATLATTAINDLQHSHKALQSNLMDTRMFMFKKAKFKALQNKLQEQNQDK